ncbi:hypothetical protein HIM_05884 [Hirsutella minnesotensis 3608]|uniref:Uncharacterized protein n=1 Tax=Hirsutella minnesotensis 3608 TaxID=1043627 RepID=A0A0F7ZZT7_9HYPO|nr:hypothetical protein HIM_05884 [Hirsutella minnesotensis 3608]
MKSFLFGGLPRHSPAVSGTSPLPLRTSSSTPSLSCCAAKSSSTKPALAKGSKSTLRACKHPHPKADVTTDSNNSVSSCSEFEVEVPRRGRSKRDPSGNQTLSHQPESSAMRRHFTPASPVQIPKHANRETGHSSKRSQTMPRKRQPRQARSTGNLHPSLAALLAGTDIPRPKRQSRRPLHLLSMDDLDDEHQVSEKDLSLTLGRGPLELLLLPPEEINNDFVENSMRGVLVRTTSAESIPSLGGDSLSSDTLSSIETSASISSPSPRRRPSPVRRSLEPVICPSDADDYHPLAVDVQVVSDFEMDLGAFDADDERPNEGTKPVLTQPPKPLRSVFRSNLTASLRALRSAARSFSGINLPPVPADDLLTRSILTIDPNVPYTDERRPPVTEEMPSAELRRYLNPTTNSLIDPQPPSSRSYSASIQMQTYKVSRSRSPSRSSWSSSGSAASSSGPHPPSRGGSPSLVPGMRQREMRENPDFIRIAVMEMAMRKQGKLDAQKPGRARWALPPRRPPTKPYEIGPNGVPARWTPVTY